LPSPAEPQFKSGQSAVEKIEKAAQLKSSLFVFPGSNLIPLAR